MVILSCAVACPTKRRPDSTVLYHALPLSCPLLFFLLPPKLPLAEPQVHERLRPEAPGHAAEYRGKNQGGRGKSGELTENTFYIWKP